MKGHLPKSIVNRKSALFSKFSLSPEQINILEDNTDGGIENIQDVHPLSPLQEGMLFHRLFNDATDTYILSTLFSLQDETHVAALASAIQTCIQRHEALRSSVLWQGLSRPLQVIWREARLLVEYLQAPPGGQAPIEQIKAYMRPVGQTLDVRRAPLTRLLVARATDSKECYALLQVHHIICDYTSLNTIVAEILAIYEGRASELGRPTPYGEYLCGLQMMPEKECNTFFRGMLGDVEEPTAPFGLVDTHGDGGNLEEIRREVSAELASKVRYVAGKRGLSPARLFHSAWALVVAATSGRDDIVYGTVVATRYVGAPAERAVGLWVNTLPVRVKLDGLSVEELLTQTHQKLSQLVEFAQIPLAFAQQCSRVPNGSPLFTSLINFRRNRHQFSTPDKQEAVVLARGEAWTNYPLSVTVEDGGAGFELIVKTDQGVGALRIARYLETITDAMLDALLNDASTPCLWLSVLPACERRELIQRCCVRRPYPQERLVHEVFEAQARRTPLSTAVVFNDVHLTFIELNQKSNQLARYLLEKGAAPDRPVGLCMDRCAQIMIALLGILKAGCAYLPLDPSYPPKRLEDIVSDAGPCVIITMRDVRRSLGDVAGELVMLDEHWPEIAQLSTSDLDAHDHPRNARSLMYVIYTSGSTGRPKGVMIEHRNVISLWRGLDQIYDLWPNCARVGVNASINFDASVKQLVQLLSGRTLVLIPQQVRGDSSMMIDYMRRLRINAIDCTPSQLRAWLAAGLLESCEHQLQIVLVGGELIDEALWRTLAHSQSVRFYNVYGPTESTVDASCASIDRMDFHPHIGAPMENRSIYILDKCRSLVPVNTVGEIYIGGAGVARGYLNRPGLTAEKFGPDVFGSTIGERLYRTGDLGRYKRDGTIEYLRRNDDQVKLRGMRIELAEVQLELARHELVLQCVVLVRNEVNVVPVPNLTHLTPTKCSSPALSLA